MLLLGKKPLKQKNNVNSFVTLKNPRIRSFVMSVFWFFIIASPLTPEKLHRNTLFEFFVKAVYTKKIWGKGAWDENHHSQCFRLQPQGPNYFTLDYFACHFGQSYICGSKFSILLSRKS